MTDRLKALLEAVKAGEVAVEDAMSRVENLPFEDIGFAHVDHHRMLRKGFPEVIFCEGKTVEQVVQDAVATIGENIKVRRFSRFVLGEGLEKRSDDFAAEVAAQVGA